MNTAEAIDKLLRLKSLTEKAQENLNSASRLQRETRTAFNEAGQKVGERLCGQGQNILLSCESGSLMIDRSSGYFTKIAIYANDGQSLFDCGFQPET